MRRFQRVLSCCLVLFLLISSCASPTAVQRAIVEEPATSTPQAAPARVEEQNPNPSRESAGQGEVVAYNPPSVPETIPWEAFFGDTTIDFTELGEMGQDYDRLFSFLGEDNPWEHAVYDGLFNLETVLRPEWFGLEGYDYDGDGIIQFWEVQEAVNAWGYASDSDIVLPDLEDEGLRRLLTVYDVNRDGVVNLDHLYTVEFGAVEGEADLDDHLRSMWGADGSDVPSEWQQVFSALGYEGFDDMWAQNLDVDQDQITDLDPLMTCSIFFSTASEALDFEETASGLASGGNPVDAYFNLVTRGLYPGLVLDGDVIAQADIWGEPHVQLVAYHPQACMEEIDQEILRRFEQLEKLEREVDLHTREAAEQIKNMHYFESQMIDRQALLEIAGHIYLVSSTLLDLTTYAAILLWTGAAIKGGWKIVAAETGSRLSVQAFKTNLALFFGELASKEGAKQAARLSARELTRQRAAFLRLVGAELPMKMGSASFYSLLEVMGKEGAKEAAYNLIGTQVNMIYNLDDYLRKKIGDPVQRFYTRGYLESVQLYQFHARQMRIKLFLMNVAENLLLLAQEVRKQASGGARSYTGIWDTNYGLLRLVQIGDRVTGTYTHDNGQIEGTIQNGELHARWWERAPGKGYDQAKVTERGDVKFKISLDADNNERSLYGEWRTEGSREYSGTLWLGNRRYRTFHEIGIGDLLDALRWNPVVQPMR